MSRSVGRPASLLQSELEKFTSSSTSSWQSIVLSVPTITETVAVRRPRRRRLPAVVTGDGFRRTLPPPPPPNESHATTACDPIEGVQIPRSASL
ncbi:unnamed protein product [Heligmosomoides polygyrus]|uniref:Uncharacterized protein n=1 Tax=Heligmosomoides polygyrus TaxID=6339 RepID=A0A183FHF5_HELPZ|nr:unnamed protein product [Heligmosomoides polygyrus]